jgi:Cu2+-containing amine oxidase
MNVFLCEPTKSSVIAAGLFPSGDGMVVPASKGAPTRHFYVHFGDLVTGRAYEGLVDVEDIEDAKVLDVEQLEEGVQPALTVEELVLTEEAIRKDARVIKQLPK